MYCAWKENDACRCRDRKGGESNDAIRNDTNQSIHGACTTSYRAKNAHTITRDESGKECIYECGFEIVMCRGGEAVRQYGERQSASAARK